MRSLLRAVVVVLAVTVAGTTIPSTASEDTGHAAATEGTLDAQRITTRSATDLAIEQAEEARAVRAAAADEAAQRRAKKRKKPLSSITIALDPGHQLGNHNYLRQTNAPVQAGGFTKPCNTTGTSTDGGVAESTVNLRLAKAVKKRLRRLGARVPMTRTVDSEQKWGPCVDARGQFGRQVGRG